MMIALSLHLKDNYEGLNLNIYQCVSFFIQLLLVDEVFFGIECASLIYNAIKLNLSVMIWGGIKVYYQKVNAITRYLGNCKSI